MTENKFFWLKLKRDFFKRHDIRIIESMPNGKDYVLFYLKLLLESIDHEGQLRFSDTIPYDENMLSIITNTNIDTVRVAIALLKQLQLIEVFDDRTIYMNEIEKMTGSETKWAEKKREYLKTLDNSRILSEASPTQVRQEIEIEKELEIDTLLPCKKDVPAIAVVDKESEFNKFWQLYPRKQSKASALKSWNKVKPLEYDKIFESLPVFIKSEQWTKSNGEFIPYPATWLNQQRWNDEVSKSSKPCISEGKKIDGGWQL